MKKAADTRGLFLRALYDLPVTDTGEGIVVDRELSSDERDLTKWIIEHGEPDAKRYLSQLDKATVSRLCYCGCASVDLLLRDSRDLTGR